MKNFETLEALWRKQSIAVPADMRKVHAVQVAAERIVNSRGRLLKWVAGWMLFGIFSAQFVTVMNFLNLGIVPTTGEFIRLGASQLLQLGLLIGLLRRIRAHRRLREKSAADVRGNVQASLDSIDAEMWDYRFAARILAGALLIDLVFAGIDYGTGHFAGTTFLVWVAFNLMLGALFAGVGGRHYWRVLRPQKLGLAELLSELNAS